MNRTAKRIVWAVASLSVAAAIVGVGADVVSGGNGCRAKTDPDGVAALEGAPPFSQGPTDQRGLWIINADGTGEARIPTGQPGGWPTIEGFSWSPDGTRIAYTDTETYSLAVTNLDGNGFHTLIPEPNPTPGQAYATGPHWSPDGHQLVFASGYSIDAITADGTARRSVTPENLEAPTRLREPAWSPDGGKIAYVATDGTAIEIINVDGSDRRTLTTHRHFTFSNPDWSPDGQRIIFAAAGGYYGSWLGIVNADGSAFHKIATHCDGSHPMWSPDGTRVAYQDHYGINVIDADGGHRTRVPNAWYGRQPAWSPDGNRIAFARY